MQAGGKYGMQTMDQSIADLIKRQNLPMDIALERCTNQEDLRRLLGEK
jgi:twitching motility protein PilT